MRRWASKFHNALPQSLEPPVGLTVCGGFDPKWLVFQLKNGAFGIFLPKGNRRIWAVCLFLHKSEWCQISLNITLWPRAFWFWETLFGGSLCICFRGFLYGGGVHHQNHVFLHFFTPVIKFHPFCYRLFPIFSDYFRFQFCSKKQKNKKCTNF